MTERGCQLKVIVDKNMPSFRGPGYFAEGPTPDLCILCGTDHGYAEEVAYDMRDAALDDMIREVVK